MGLKANAGSSMYFPYENYYTMSSFGSPIFDGKKAAFLPGAGNPQFFDTLKLNR
jgi:hypothetical protein